MRDEEYSRKSKLKSKRNRKEYNRVSKLYG